MFSPDFSGDSAADFVAVTMSADTWAWINPEMRVIVDDTWCDPFARSVDHDRSIRCWYVLPNLCNFAVDEQNIAARDFAANAIKNGGIFDQSHFKVRDQRLLVPELIS